MNFFGINDVEGDTEHWTDRHHKYTSPVTGLTKVKVFKIQRMATPADPGSSFVG